MDALMTCLRRLVIRRWRHCLIISLLILVPLLVLQWIMLEEERSKHFRPILNFESPHDLFHRDWATSGTIPHLLTRALHYCNMPIQLGKEGRLRIADKVTAKELQLRSVYIVFRHGDRAPMTSYRKFSYNLNCNIDSLRRQDDTVLEMLLDRLKARRPPTRGFFARSMPYSNETFCSMGRMTPQGVLQNFLLGHHLATAYSELISDLRLGQELRVVVTRSIRTFHSAVALLEALLQSHPERTSQIKLDDFNVVSNIAFCNTKRYPCSCPKLRFYFSHIREVTAKLRDNPNVARLRYAFSELLGMSSDEDMLPNLNDLVDATMPLVCNKFRSIMCAKDDAGQRRCLSQRMIHELWKVHDSMGRDLVHDPSTIRYGKLVMFPFLDELLKTMEAMAAAKTDTSSDDERDPLPRLTLFAGHDHSIRYLLTALGLYDGSWPPLSSRVVFELYGPKESESAHRVAKGIDLHYFRLLYNGEVLTHVLPFCKAKLCPLRNFKSFLSNDFWISFGTSKYSQACTA